MSRIAASIPAHAQARAKTAGDKAAAKVSGSDPVRAANAPHSSRTHLPLNPASIPVHPSAGALPAPSCPLSFGNPLPLQRKLSIGSASDPLEAEADRVAEQVMGLNGSAPQLSASGAEPAVQRKCACAGSGAECAECKKKKEEKLQRKAQSPVAPVEAPPIVHQVLRSPGQPLDRSTRAFFEPRLGQDLSHVRVHADAQANRSASAVASHAYAVGNDIAFAAGQYEPASHDGRRLLAHELAHVVQQGSAGQVVRRQADAGAPDAASPQSTAIDRVIAALNEPQGNGVGNYREAYSILNGLWIVDMMHQIEQLKARSYFDLLKDNDPGQFPRVTVAIAAVAAKGTPAAAQFPAQNPAFSSIEEQQQHEVATYLGLPWPIPQAASAGGGQIATPGEILKGVLEVTAVIAVGAVVVFVAPEALPFLAAGVRALAVVVAIGSADVIAGAAVEAGTAVTVQLVVDAAAVGGEDAAVATVVGDTAAVTTGETATAANAAAETTAATETTTAATTSTTASTTSATTSAATRTAAAVAGTVAASTTMSSDSPSQQKEKDKKKRRPPFVLKLPQQKAPHLQRYRSWLGVLQSDPYYLRGNTAQRSVWNQALRIGGSEAIPASVYERGHQLGLTGAEGEERIRIPDWSPTVTASVDMQVDHVIELQVTPAAMREEFNSIENMELLEANANEESGRLLQQNIQQEREKQIAFDPSAIDRTLVFDKVEMDGGSPGDHWTVEQLREGQQLDRYQELNAQ